LATYPSSRSTAHFGRFQVDLVSGELLRSGVRLSIQEKPLHVLRLLLQAEGKIVTREQIRAALWPEDIFVDFEHGVNTAVKKLRQALEDSAEHPKFIETLPKIGYRFMVDVEWGADARVPSRLPSVVPIASSKPTLVPQPIPRRKWKLKLAIALATLVTIVSGVLFSNENSRFSHTRLGTWLGQVVLGRHLHPRVALSQRRLTANTDDAPLTGGVISPDGKYLAYTDASGFYLRQVDDGETHPVPLPKGFDVIPDSWFPDSAHLVVSWFGDQKTPPHLRKPRTGPPSLWKISVLGGTPRKLANEGSSGRISPDGSKIAFLAGMWDHEQIWLVEPDGSNARKIVDGGQDSFGAVAWAPDGKRFAYVRTANPPNPGQPGKQIEVYDVATGRSEVVSSESRLRDEIAWINTGRLIYSLDEVEPNQSDSNLWSIQLAPHTERPSGAPTRITNDRGSTAGISVAADGKRMALLRSTFQGDIYIAEIGAQDSRLSAPRRFTRDEREDWPSSWTPDSKTVLFISERDGPAHIFKQSINETMPDLLVGGNDIVRAPRLAPDGLSALYGVRAKPDEPHDNLRVMRVPVSGGPSQFVMDGRGITDFECARHPATLCIYGQMVSNSGYRFFSFDPDGTNRTGLLPEKLKEVGGVRNWGLSPDGKYLVTSKSQNPYDEPALRIVNLAKGTEQYIPMPDMGLMIGMDWAADSKSVWVGGYRGRGAWGTRSGILNVDLKGRVKVAIEGFNPSILFAVPSPDGHRLALYGNTQSSNMWLLESF
jgi:Tol biopolymer transport system component/DNA-binding winged helix-turn-helix (wHTH) protein